MVIAAYSGTGKTCFAGRVKNSIDLVTFPYKYIFEGPQDDDENESIKASHDYLMQREWPANYARAIIDMYSMYDYISIAPVREVLAELRREEIPYILCYPDRSLKAEYEQRYIDRGNTEDFLDIFIGGWDRFLDMYEKDPGDYHMVLQRGQYLTDILPILESIRGKEETAFRINLHWGDTQ